MHEINSFPTLSVIGARPHLFYDDMIHRPYTRCVEIEDLLPTGSVLFEPEQI